jgi:hypothetical protein
MNAITFWFTVFSAACWPVCFWWMHRISVRQNSLLQELREQGKRIEKLSREEHDLIKEVHPEVEQIQSDVADVKSHVSNQTPG